ncbi:MAG: hypothetical protein KAI66_26355, partial [Lentisphaeria bacterium]|nr:hypothetical protein [Lentisphaeria bacterium]
MSFALVNTVALAELPGATRLEARVLAILAGYANDEGEGIFVGIGGLCEKHGMPAGSVRRGLRRMTKAGWIVDVGRHRNTAGQLTNIRSRRIDVNALDVKLVSEPKKKGSPVPIWDPCDHPVDQALRSPGGQSLRSPGGQSLRSPGGQPMGTSDGTSDGSNNPLTPIAPIPEVAPRPTDIEERDR